MAYISTLGSPGVEVHEVDNSIRLSASSGTTVFVPGYAAQGPVEEVISISSIEDFETTFGVPTNGAERYFYYTVLALLNNSGAGTTVLVSRLPYGVGEGDTVSEAFTVLGYPAIPIVKKNDSEYDAPCYTISSADVKKIFDSLVIETTVTTTDDENNTETATHKLYFNRVDENNYSGILYTSHEYSNKDNVSISNLPKDAFDVVKSDAIPNDDNFFKFNVNGLLGDVDKDLTANGYMVFNGEDIIITASIKKEEVGTDVNVGYIVLEAKGIGSLKTLNGEKYEHYEYLSEYIGDVETLSVVKSDSNETTSLTFNKIYGLAQPLENNQDDTLKIDYSIAEGSSVSFDGAVYDTNNLIINEANKSTVFKNVTYILGSPVTHQISLSDYYKLLTGELFTWSRNPAQFDDEADEITSGDVKSYKFGKSLQDLANCALIFVNTSRTVINDDYEGYYFGITDNLYNEPNNSRTLSAIESVKITTNRADGSKGTGLVDGTESPYTALADARTDFYTRSNNTGSISRVLQTGTTSFDTSDELHDDTISLALFKLSKSTMVSNITKLSYTLRESYNCSLGKKREQSVSSSTAPVSYFAENVMKNSANLTVLVNPFISNKIIIDTDGVLRGKVRFFSNKLIENMETDEQKYIKTGYNNSKAVSTAIMPVKIVKNAISNYIESIRRVGIDLNSLFTIFGNSDDGTTGVIGENFTKSNSLYPFGVYTELRSNNKIIGNTPRKISRSLELVSNDEEYPDLDILVEGGLGTIYAYSNTKNVVSEGLDSVLFAGEDLVQSDSQEEDTTGKALVFDETAILTGVEDLRTGRSSLSDEANEVIQDFMSVQNSFLEVANSYVNGGRNDCFYIGDTIRGILIKGKDTKVEKLYGTILTNNAYDDVDSVNHSWSTSIYYPHKHIFNNFVTSYASVYAQWFKVNDYTSDNKIWVPASGYVAALMCAADAAYGPWAAAAGPNRGIVNGVIDVAVNPTLKQRTDLYKICINSIPSISGNGIMVYGIRTMSKKASAFDQNTCRRTFLLMTKNIKKVLRYFVFELNNTYTRLSIYNTIEPYLSTIKTKGGIDKFTLVCDSTNNTAEVIDNGEIAVDVAATPSRTGENIVLTMTANKHTSDVSTSTYGAE